MQCHWTCIHIHLLSVRHMLICEWLIQCQLVGGLVELVCCTSCLLLEKRWTSSGSRLCTCLLASEWNLCIQSQSTEEHRPWAQPFTCTTVGHWEQLVFFVEELEAVTRLLFSEVECMDAWLLAMLSLCWLCLWEIESSRWSETAVPETWCYESHSRAVCLS